MRTYAVCHKYEYFQCPMQTILIQNIRIILLCVVAAGQSADPCILLFTQEWLGNGAYHDG